MDKFVYILFHSVEDRDESFKIIGVFENENDAKNAIEIVIDKSGFKDHSDGFLIDKYKINEVNWIDGFGIY